MKVAFTIGAINRGGAETLLLDVMKRASQLPFEAMLIHRNGGDYEVDFKETGQPCVHLCPRHHRYMSYLLALRKILRENKIDIVHAQCWLDCIYGKIASFGLPIKVVVTMHGYYGCECNWFWAVIYRIAFLCADTICFVSNYQKSRYVERYGKLLSKKCKIVYNGVDISKFGVISDEIHLRPQLCMVGNFNEVRSQKVIVDAIKILKDKRIDNFDFYFIGGRYNGCEYLYDNCVTYCDVNRLSNVHFLGLCGNVPERLQRMDGFVYSTKNDTFGIAIVEAMVIGLPVLANDYPVVNEITHFGQWATLFKTEDVEDCANKIKDLLEHLQERKTSAKQIANDVREEYSIENHIKRLYEIYQL